MAARLQTCRVVRVFRPALGRAGFRPAWQVDVAKLNEGEIDRRMKTVSGWTREGDAIRKEYTFASFPDAIAFVNRIAAEAEKADHHPDILVSYKRVTLTWSTHSEGGLTAKDFEGAGMADRVA